jgi:hypothetical protein
MLSSLATSPADPEARCRKHGVSLRTIKLQRIDLNTKIKQNIKN